jgi:hypothetical protein
MAFGYHSARLSGSIMPTAARPTVYGVGNAIVDLQVRVDDAFLEGRGVPKGQMRLVDDARQAEVLAALASLSVNRCSGGSAANTVVGVADLGGKAAYCGKVGRDDLGDFYLDDLRAVGIAVDGERSTIHTGTCLVLVTPDAQRTMLTNLGASARLSPSDVSGDGIEGCEYVYVEGYLFTGDTTRAAALRAIEIAKAKGVKVALTVSDPFVIGLHRDALWELIKGPVDLLFCNEQEAKALTGLDDPIACAQLVHQHAASVALTLGPKGSILMHRHEVYPIEGVPVQAVDTTGAGDMYAAGILYGITHGLDWPTAGHLASHAAARVVTQLGARLPRKFTPEELRALGERK